MDAVADILAVAAKTQGEGETPASMTKIVQRIATILRTVSHEDTEGYGVLA